jgi:DMSO reductase family type II enzyme heme b subunit
MTSRSSGAACIATLAALVAVACGDSGVRPAPAEVLAVHRTAVALDPDAADWRGVPEFAAALVPQDMVEPRLLAPSTAEVRVRAMSDGTRIAFRLEWADPTTNDTPDVSRFSDACAVQLPARVEPDVPAPQMGEPGRPVEVSYWRATWQSVVDGRPDTIAAIHPNAAVDHYPFEAPSLPAGSPERQEMARRYAPARALANDMAGPRTRPVEDLVAEGPGTLRPAAARSDGRGRRVDAGWAVVLVRPLPAALAPGQRAEVAFAVWEGSNGEVGARKMRSVWVPLLLEGGAP